MARTGADVAGKAKVAAEPAAEGAAAAAPQGAGELAQKAGSTEARAQRGAGGTSASRDPNGDGEAVRRVGGEAKAAALAASAAPAAGAAGQLMFTMMLLNWFKTMFFAALAAVMNVIAATVAVAMAVGKVIFGGTLAAGAAVSSFVGGAVSAATAAVATATMTALVVGASVVSIVAGANGTAQRDGALADCSSDIVAAANIADAGAAGANAAVTLANAQTVYGVLSAWGMPDENIAGILGNWDVESGIDPTGVETVSGEPFSLGTKKQDAESKGFDARAVAPEYAAKFPGVQLLGIGLGQWSNDRNTQLREYAKGTGKWASLETQLGFMISKDSGAPVIKNMIAHPVGSAAAAAVYFHNEWERSADTSTSAREAAATKWFAKMGGWTKNKSLADSILAQSGSTLAEANVTRVSDAKANCRTGKVQAAAGLKQGGLTLAEAQALMATYRLEGEAVLVQAFGSGGPGDCGYGKSDNCVGFSAYFTYKFTSFKQFAPGNGIDTAASLAKLTNRSTSSVPTPYSVFSEDNGTEAGHTGVILGIQGDQAIIGEASCGTDHAGTRAYARPLSELTPDKFKFTDVPDLITASSMS